MPLPPVRRQILLRIAKDFEDRLSHLRRQVRELLLLHLSRENVEQALIYVILRLLRQAVEAVGIDQVAQRVLEQPALKVEVAQAAALEIARAAGGEVLGECRGSF